MHWNWINPSITSYLPVPAKSRLEYSGRLRTPNFELESVKVKVRERKTDLAIANRWRDLALHSIVQIRTWFPWHNPPMHIRWIKGITSVVTSCDLRCETKPLHMKSNQILFNFLLHSYLRSYKSFFKRTKVGLFAKTNAIKSLGSKVSDGLWRRAFKKS